MGTSGRSPEIIATIVNAMIVLALPLLAAALFSVGKHDNVSVIVHPPGWSPALAALRAFLDTAIPMSPLAAIAAWRTWVHARRWRAGNRDVVGIVEATACGVAVATLLALAAPRAGTTIPAMLPGLLLVDLIGACIGLVVGLLLHATAVVVLTLAERAMNARRCKFV